MDERGTPVTLQSVANSRSTIDMFSAGFYEMLARQITADLEAIRDRIAPGQNARLLSKGIAFGRLGRNGDGTWVTTAVEDLPPQSLASADAQHPPSLLILPFHQAASTVSLRVFTNDAFNQHHGMQSTERFGIGTDPDGDGVVNELTRADISAATLFSSRATRSCAGRATRSCVAESSAGRRDHVPANWLRGLSYSCVTARSKRLDLYRTRPYNPAGNLQVGQVQSIALDLTSEELRSRASSQRTGSFGCLCLRTSSYTISAGVRTTRMSRD